MLIRPATAGDITALQQLSPAVTSPAEAGHDTMTLVAEADDQTLAGFLVAHYDLTGKNAHVAEVYALDDDTTAELKKHAEAALNNMGCYFEGTAPVDESEDNIALAPPPAVEGAEETPWVEESISDEFAESAVG